MVPAGAFVVVQKEQPGKIQDPVVKSDDLRESVLPPKRETPPVQQSISLFLNGQPIKLAPKADGSPYYVMDLLERSGMDFENIQRPVSLRLNGGECLFQQVLKAGDRVEIGYEDEVRAP